MVDEVMGGGDSAVWGSASVVKETGLAVVHKDERIVPAPGSAAVIATAPAAGVVEYRFPVEIVVVGALGDAERRRLEAGIWERLADALERLA